MFGLVKDSELELIAHEFAALVNIILAAARSSKARHKSIALLRMELELVAQKSLQCKTMLPLSPGVRNHYTRI